MKALRLALISVLVLVGGWMSLPASAQQSIWVLGRGGVITSAIYLLGNVQMTSGQQIGWTASATDASGALDTLLCRGAANVIGLGGCTSSFPALKRSAATLAVRVGDDTSYAGMDLGFLQVAGKTLLHTTAPTISSGFGTSPSIVNNNGTAAFTINVGTGGVATSGVIGLPTATTGWNCFAIDRTTNVVTRETATTTTSATLTAASAWAASDILQVSCFAY